MDWTIIIASLLSLIFITPISGTLSKKSPKNIKVKSEKNKSGPQNFTVFSKNLVSEEPHSDDVLDNNKCFFREVDEFNFEGLVLGYVTPWNNHGYDIAKIFGNKFTHISPVWLQVKRTGANKYEILGTHDVDKGWMVDVRNAGRERKLKIVPRMLFDSWSGEDYQNLFSKESEVLALAKSFIHSAEKFRFDGYVLEIWSQIAQVTPFDTLVGLVKYIATALGEQGLEIILVVPPKRGNENFAFNDKHFEALYEYVTAFSLMTYDFSNAQRPGPNAPLPWIEECITSLTSDKRKRKKILTGLNFYGNDYSQAGGGPIVSHEYIERLQLLNGKLEYNTQFAEHYFEYMDQDSLRHIVFYPTLYSVNRRLQLCKELKTGVSIWELGQGLDYFYDLL